MADEFAQTRGADDLFDDEIIPVSTEEQSQPGGTQQLYEDPIVKQDDAPPQAPTQPRSRSRGGERGRGRGRGRGRRRGPSSNRRTVGGGGSGPRRHNNAWENASEAESASVNTNVNVGDPVREKSEGPEKEEDNAASEKVPAANGHEVQRVPAVRGDRSATGGIKKPKLTEEQLSQRIAAAKENAAKLSAAHARAEADQASFLQREKQADQKRKQERQNRRVMDSERERNRQRKMDALNGREWDATKHEEDYNPRGGKSQFRRGMHGGVSGHTRRDLDDARAGDDWARNEQGLRGRERGRGGRGRTGSRGPQRDSTPHDGPATATENTPPVINNVSEFPALPGGDKESRPGETKPVLEVKTKSDQKDTTLSPVAGTSWADQVEAQ